jgi:hypothetical protein
MAHYEFRIATECDDATPPGYNVTVWMREYTANPDATGWHVVKTGYIRGHETSKRPIEVFRWLMRCLS